MEQLHFIFVQHTNQRKCESCYFKPGIEIYMQDITPSEVPVRYHTNKYFITDTTTVRLLLGQITKSANQSALLQVK